MTTASYVTRQKKKKDATPLQRRNPALAFDCLHRVQKARAKGLYHVDGRVLKVEAPTTYNLISRLCRRGSMRPGTSVYLFLLLRDNSQRMLIFDWPEGGTPSGVYAAVKARAEYLDRLAMGDRRLHA